MMNNIFLKTYDDHVVSQLIGNSRMNIDLASVSIRVISNDTRYRYTPSSENNFSYKNQKDAINIDENISPYGWKAFSILPIKHDDTVKSLAVLVTDLKSTTKATEYVGKTSLITTCSVDD